MDPCKEIRRGSPKGDTDPGGAVTVPRPVDAGLPRCTHAPLLPGAVPDLGHLGQLGQITMKEHPSFSKELPRIVVAGLVFPEEGHRRCRTVIPAQSHADTVGVVLGLSHNSRHEQDGNHQKLSHTLVLPEQCFAERVRVQHVLVVDGQRDGAAADLFLGHLDGKHLIVREGELLED